jgi:VWFA-related protein
MKVYTSSVRSPAWLLVGCAAVFVGLASAHGRADTPRDGHGREPGDDGVVRVTAVVTDTRGRPVPGLGAADFKLLVDGEPQAIDSVELTQAPREAPRSFAFLLDEFHTNASDSAVVRAALLRFADRALRPDDGVMVVKPLDSLTGLAPSADREAMRNAITTFEGRKGDYTPRTVFERNFMAQAPAAVASARAQIVTAALRAVGVSLAAARAVRPAIVFVTDGFPRARASRDVPASLLTAVRIANRAEAPVYAFAPALVPAPDHAPEADGPFAVLAALTARTGGALVTGTAALEPGLDRMTRDLDAHYVLTWRPAHGSDGRFHELQVGLTRPGAQVRARSGYLAPMSAAARAARTPAPTAPVRVLRRSNLILSWSGIIPAAPGRARVTVSWEPTASRATPGSRPRAASIVVTAAAPDGTRLFDAAVGPVGTGTAAAGVPDHASFDAPTGPVRIDMKILDTKGVVIDTDARDIVVPAHRPAGSTIYPPAVIRTRSGREFRLLASDPEAPGVPAREFRRTERLIIRVAALDAAGGPAPVAATLLNRTRQPMRALTPLADGLAPGIAQFDLPLSSLAPGDYSVRLTSGGLSDSASEYVLFRIVG